jgi:D-alanyl-D-alanine carboxypeptidase
MAMLGRIQAVGAVLTVAAVAAIYPIGSATATGGGDYPGLRTVMRRLTTEAGTTGALADVRDRHGQTVITSGVGDLRTGAPVPEHSRFRIGSVTKTFVATVVLQLAGAHRIDLDGPVEQYLPGLIRGNGNDGRHISIRHLLQHTSGLPDYLDDSLVQQVIADPLAHRDTHLLIQAALQHPSLFPPGEQFSYSNTNYLVAGLLIEKITGRPYGREIERRILRPLRLHDTAVPGDEISIRGPHPNGYLRNGPDQQPTEQTRFNPSVAGAAGEMNSSSRDLNRFFAALIGVRLLNPAELREMMRTRPTPSGPSDGYGLGLERTTLPCGGVYWGHDGDSLGFSTRVGVTTTGKQVTVMANLNPGASEAQDVTLSATVPTALCQES